MLPHSYIFTSVAYCIYILKYIQYACSWKKLKYVCIYILKIIIKGGHWPKFENNNCVLGTFFEEGGTLICHWGGWAYSIVSNTIDMLDSIIPSELFYKNKTISSTCIVF